MIRLDYKVVTVEGSADHQAMQLAREGTPMRIYYRAKMHGNKY